MDTQLTENQRAARVALMFGMTAPMTREEAMTALDRLYAEWPETLKAKAGRLGELVRIEDERAASQSPEK